jgi:hypothetical protein
VAVNPPGFDPHGGRSLVSQRPCLSGVALGKIPSSKKILTNVNERLVKTGVVP